jgi:hypothetical protein
LGLLVRAACEAYHAEALDNKNLEAMEGLGDSNGVDELERIVCDDQKSCLEGS